MWKNDSIDGWERKEKSWINVGLNPDVTYTWWIHSFIKRRVMFFFFKLLLKTFNNFLKDKCNVSTIFCYFKTEKYMENYSTRTILEKTSPYIKISKLQLLIFQPSSCWPFLKKANIAIYQNYPEMDFVRRKVGKISYFSIPIFEYRVSYFFGTLNIAVSSEYYQLCSPRSYNFIHPSNGWVELNVFESDPGEMS